MNTADTIAAPATGHGGAIAVIRLSGTRSFEVTDKVFCSATGRVSEAAGYTILYGTIKDGEHIVDDVLVSVFRAPHSYTGEDSVEISCHASDYIIREIMRLLTSSGARTAQPGEFTIRAFLNGKMDLSEAEAVADIIASQSRTEHDMAVNQMRGGFSRDLAQLRSQLLKVTSLLELELDFSEEDVQFADRSELRSLLETIKTQIAALKESFSVGNVLKQGVTVAIVGRPNVGKSTLLNRLLGDDRAMVSEIAGTTRDTIEDTAVIDGVLFRFVDTAGLHDTDDRLEQMGIERTYNIIKRAHVVLNVTDNDTADAIQTDAKVIKVVNKTDIRGEGAGISSADEIHISAKFGAGIDDLRRMLRDTVDTAKVDSGQSVVSNSRHYEALENAERASAEALTGIASGLTADMLSESVRAVLYALGSITGEITSDEVLGTIFSKFCIGK